MPAPGVNGVTGVVVGGGGATGPLELPDSFSPPLELLDEVLPPDEDELLLVEEPELSSFFSTFFSVSEPLPELDPELELLLPWVKVVVWRVSVMVVTALVIAEDVASGMSCVKMTAFEAPDEEPLLLVLPELLLLELLDSFSPPELLEDVLPPEEVLPPEVEPPLEAPGVGTSAWTTTSLPAGIGISFSVTPCMTTRPSAVDTVKKALPVPSGRKTMRNVVPRIPAAPTGVWTL